MARATKGAAAAKPMTAEEQAKEKQEYYETLKERARQVAGAETRIRNELEAYTLEAPKEDFARARTALKVHAGRFDASIRKHAKATGIDPDILRAVIAVEQRREPTVPKTYKKSNKGAQGLTQLMPNTVKRFNVRVDDPDDAIRGAAESIAEVQKRLHTKDPYFLAASYNAGDPWVRSYGGAMPAILPKETENYLAIFDEAYRAAKEPTK
jgi:soluble lytic murein transglycosylase-like protein